MKDKIVIVTGASQGLGKELSIKLAKLGAKIALVARNEKLLSEVKSEINKNGGLAEVFVCDVIDIEAINLTVSKIVNTFKTVDVLVNNAGIWTNDKLEEKDKRLVERTFMVNSVAPINFYKAIAPIFEKNKKGHFVFINSISGFEMKENKDYAVYTASKWALTGFANALKNKYDGTDIKVSSIHPGPIDSKMPDNSGDDWGKDKSWMMSTKEVADMVIFAMSAPGKIQVETMTFKKTSWNS